MHKKPKICVVCREKYDPKNMQQLCCSKKCQQINHTNVRYRRENGDWKIYFKYLLSKGRRENLTPEILEELLEKQDYKCALSGIELTCIKQRGVRIKTNASIDRINAGGEYNTNNIQLVCAAINSFRQDTTVDDFINWCKRVTEYAIHKNKEALQKRIRATKSKG
jgi:predicted nucleic acid-binding Zn ribbon protein